MKLIQNYVFMLMYNNNFVQLVKNVLFDNSETTIYKFSLILNFHFIFVK
jgi:hypothetical protein